MVNNPKVSFVAPSIRPHLWSKFYNSLSNNTTEWEVIFAGPLKPEFDLSEYPRLRYIYATCKPSQCTHIAFMEASGEYVSLTADDAQYFTPDGKGAIDNIMNFIGNFPSDKNYYNSRIAYGFRMFEDSSCLETSQNHYLVPKDKTALLYPFFVINKKSYLELNGYDNRFICGQAENDFLLRVYQNYGYTTNSLCPTAMVWADHDSGHENISKFRQYHIQESSILKSLWFNENNYTNKRFSELLPYEWREDIYTKSQGNVGEWL